MPSGAKSSAKNKGILNALLPGARLDKNTNKILVHVGTSNETITFNIGGTTFETYKSTLRAIPKSPLASDAFLAKHYRQDRKDYFFDRDPKIFHCVLNFFRTGELHLPTSVCGPVVKSELEYWGVDEVDIEECCWSRYSTWASTLLSLRKLEEDRHKSMQLGAYPHEENPSCIRRGCRKAWRFFSEPSSSAGAQIFAYVCIAVIFISIFSFCAQTHELFRVKESYRVLNTTATTPPSPSSFSTIYESQHSGSAINITNGTSTLENGSQYYTVVADVPHPILYYLDVACLIFFFIELFSRFLVSPNKINFILLPMTIIEFLALLPDLVDVVAKLVSTSFREYENVTDFMSFLKLLRVFRIFRLMRHIPGLWILFYTLKASVKDLLLLLLFVGVGMLVFSSLVFFAESGTQEEFSSIPKCFWWAVITMTTVGYGDMYPVTNWGYLIGTVTGISGVLMIGFTVPVLVNNFIMYYNHTNSTIHREKHREINASTANLRPFGALGGRAAMGGLGLGEKVMGMGGFKVDLPKPVDSNANETRHVGDDSNGNGNAGSVEDDGPVGCISKEVKVIEGHNSGDEDEDDVKQTPLLHVEHL